jgi:glucose-6-phosphate isomerase
MTKPYASRSHEDMKDVLMDPSSIGPEIHYYMIRGGTEKGNITVWESGTVGGEYVKTYGHYHVDDIEEIYKIIQGEGILLIQEREKDADGQFINDKIVSFKALRVKAGDIISIPPFSGHALVNIGKSWLVTYDDSPVALNDSASMPMHADYEPIKIMKGFAYYVIEKDGKPTLVKNNNYKDMPDCEIVEYNNA